MGVVYCATDLRLGRSVALKVIAPEFSDDPAYRQRFERESRIAESLRHPHVVTVLEAGEADGSLYVTMEHVDGLDLRELITRDGRLAPRRLSAVVAQVASALDDAHARGLVHRDVKPANVLVSLRDDGREHAYLTDFGLAKHVMSQSGLTEKGTVLGTLDYIAPEQIRGTRLDARTDVYGLGCVLFHALTGEVLFPDSSGAAKLFSHLSEPPRAPCEALPGLAPAWDPVLARALAKQPADRYPSAGVLAEATFATAQA
jgi:serine/threonine-protein kinase